MISRFKARYGKWLWLVLDSLVLLPMVRAGFFLAAGELRGVLAMLAETGIVLLLLWSLLPRAYELWPDRLRIVLGWRLGLNFPLDEIEENQHARGIAALCSWGAMFVTSINSPVRIRRTRGMGITISPNHPLEFIESVRGAQANSHGGQAQA